MRAKNWTLDRAQQQRKRPAQRGVMDIEEEEEEEKSL